MRLIDGDELLAQMVGMADGWFDPKPAYDYESLVKQQPTVDAAPVKHGRWIPVLNGIDDDTNPAFDCSECDAMCNKKHNYCPACGAKMDLEEQDADRK